jgi:hypothetical protein
LPFVVYLIYTYYNTNVLNGQPFSYQNIKLD